MFLLRPADGAPFKDDIRELFYQRTLICLWLGVVFFTLFAFLDFVCCRSNFSLFIIYRIVYVVILIAFINLLTNFSSREYAPYLLYAAMVLGGFVISLMTVRLGGFYSGYYVGILLMIAGALSVLPLTVGQVLFVGLSMYVVYVSTVLLGTTNLEKSHLAAMVNNSFFFLALVGVTAVQSFDDLQTFLKSLRAKKSLQQIRRELTIYTGDLEDLVQQRLAELEESDLRYRDVYNNILDLVILVDGEGVVRSSNQHSRVLLGCEPEQLTGRSLLDYLAEQGRGKEVVDAVIRELVRGKTVQGVQLKIRRDKGVIIETELSANRLEIEDEAFYQLVIRDISGTKAIERQLLDSERLIDTSRQAAIFGLARLAECRDDDTGAHLSRIRSYTRILVDDLAELADFQNGVDEGFIEDILRSSVLHDIGKVGIPDVILLKPGRLTEEEFEEMKHHCRLGSEILAEADRGEESVSYLHIGREIARHHHERWDGRGYPDGLSGTDIPLSARIVALADVYDALTSARVYKPAYNHDKAKELISKEVGEQFDPAIVNAFLRRESEFKETRMQFLMHEPEQDAS